MKFFKRSKQEEHKAPAVSEERVISLTAVEEDETGEATNTYTYPDQSVFDDLQETQDRLHKTEDISCELGSTEARLKDNKEELASTEGAFEEAEEVSSEVSDAPFVEERESSGDAVDADLPVVACTIENESEKLEVTNSWESNLVEEPTSQSESSTAPEQETQEEAVYVAEELQERNAPARSDEVKPVNHAKQARTRLIGIIAALIVGFIILVCVTVWIFIQSSEQAKEEADHQGAASITSQHTEDARSQSSKHLEVPKLAGLFGKTQEEVLASLGDGAIVGSETEASNASSQAVKTLTIPLALGDEEDHHTAAPVVYLGLNTEGKVVSVGFASSTTLLGFAPTSFVDALKSEHIIQKVMGEAGFSLEGSEIVIPENRDDYTQINSETGLVESERYSFTGSLNYKEQNLTWSATLSYDYSAANASGNLNDSIRQIVISVSE